MQDVRAGAGQLGRIEHVVDRGLLSGGWARGEEAGVIPSGGRRGVIDGLRVFGVHDEQAVERRQFLHGCEQLLPGQRWELRHPGSSKNALNPKTPASCSSRSEPKLAGTAPRNLMRSVGCFWKARLQQRLAGQHSRNPAPSEAY